METRTITHVRGLYPPKRSPSAPPRTCTLPRFTSASYMKMPSPVQKVATSKTPSTTWITPRLPSSTHFFQPKNSSVIRPPRDDSSKSSSSKKSPIKAPHLRFNFPTIVLHIFKAHYTDANQVMRKFKLFDKR